MKRVERVRLYPNPGQELAFRFALDVTRELYNALLQERRDAYRLRFIRIKSTDQYAEITGLRKPVSRLDTRLAAVYRDCEDAVLHRLDCAFTAFFRRLRRGEKPGYPRFKPASRWRQLLFSHGSRALKFDESQRRITTPSKRRRSATLRATFAIAKIDSAGRHSSGWRERKSGKPIFGVTPHIK